MNPMAVIPAKAGIHCALMQKAKWIPAFAGMTAVGVAQIPMVHVAPRKFLAGQQCAKAGLTAMGLRSGLIQINVPKPGIPIVYA